MSKGCFQVISCQTYSWEVWVCILDRPIGIAGTLSSMISDMLSTVISRVGSQRVDDAIDAGVESALDAGALCDTE